MAVRRFGKPQSPPKAAFLLGILLVFLSSGSAEASECDVAYHILPVQNAITDYVKLKPLSRKAKGRSTRIMIRSSDNNISLGFDQPVFDDTTIKISLYLKYNSQVSPLEWFRRIKFLICQPF